MLPSVKHNPSDCFQSKPKNLLLNQQHPRQHELSTAFNLMKGLNRGLPQQNVTFCPYKPPLNNSNKQECSDRNAAIVERTCFLLWVKCPPEGDT